MSGSPVARAVRLPRHAAAPTGSTHDPAPEPVLPESSALPQLRINRSGTRRALRLSVLFVLGVGALFAIFAVYSRSAPGGGSPGAQQLLEVFAVFAVAIAAGGAVFALSSAPRAVEFRSTGTIVVGRFGRRRVFPAVSELSVRLVRRYPSGFFSATDVDAVEVVGGRQRGTYLLEEGILAITFHDRSRAGG